jgi:hypothetical protein
MPILVRLVREELRIYVALVRWIVRRPAVPAGATAWGYSRTIAALMGLWIFASAAEVPVLHVLIGWFWVRLSVDILAVWGFVWMLSALAALRVYPHLIDAGGIRVRSGVRADVRIAGSAVDSLAVVDRHLPSAMRTFQPRQSDDGVDLQIAVGKQVNLSVRLREPVDVRTPKGIVTASSITFLVDEPKQFLAAATPHVQAAQSERRALPGGG